MRWILFWGLITIVSFVQASVADTMTGALSPRFKSVQVWVNDNDQAPPVIFLDGADRITVTFDEIAEERSYFRCTLTHCNSLWQPDGLVENEFLGGFNDYQIDDYEYSRATTVHYVNYRLTIPNDDLKPTISGNYLLRVYEDGAPDDVLLQVRFYVVEGWANVRGSYSGRTDIDYRSAHQQLDVSVDGGDDMTLDDLSNRLRVVVVQNGRHDNVVVVDKPQYITGNTARFDHLRPFIFPAGNEYRRFETVAINSLSMNVTGVDYVHPFYHAEIRTDFPRASEGYAYDLTQHGRYRVREQNSADSHVEADYIMTHFSLKTDPLPGYDIYVDGDFTSRRFDPSSRMNYDYESGVYRMSALLKQGSYNYQYLAVPKGSTTGLTAPLEGDFYQTDNEYLVLVYYLVPGARYERLIGVTLIDASSPSVF
ncbi:MAG: DUF5103 domain-containing protein [Muribaculum sp.]|nr:DUF5103 domain-containing protein [Muribaculum sp.]